MGKSLKKLLLVFYHGNKNIPYSNLEWTCWGIPNIWENPIVWAKIAFVIVYLSNLSGSTWKNMFKLVLFHPSVCVGILSWYVNSYVYIATIYIHYNCIYIYKNMAETAAAWDASMGSEEKYIYIYIYNVYIIYIYLYIYIYIYIYYIYIYIYYVYMYYIYI